MMRFFLASGALFALVGVVSRALSAHALIDRLTASGKLDQFNLASDYILIHGLALIAVMLLLQAAPCRPATLAGCCFFVGGLLFPVTVFIKCFAPMGTSGIDGHKRHTHAHWRRHTHAGLAFACLRRAGGKVCLKR